jgi:hypothetical protein
MNSLSETYDPESETQFAWRIQTPEGLRVWGDGVEITSAAWARERVLHLFQYLVTIVDHKEDTLKQ